MIQVTDRRDIIKYDSHFHLHMLEWSSMDDIRQMIFIFRPLELDVFFRFFVLYSVNTDFHHIQRNVLIPVI